MGRGSDGSEDEKLPDPGRRLLSIANCATPVNSLLPEDLPQGPSNVRRFGLYFCMIMVSSPHQTGLCYNEIQY